LRNPDRKPLVNAIQLPAKAEAEVATATAKFSDI